MLLFYLHSLGELLSSRRKDSVKLERLGAWSVSDQWGSLGPLICEIYLRQYHGRIFKLCP